jgi:AraC-like DNA-binding protein
MLHECKFFGELLAINIPKGMIGRKNEEILSDRPVMSMHGQMTQFVGFIRSEFKQNPESKALYHLYNYLCDKLLENISLASVRFIRQNYDQPVTIKQLAELENYSVTYFNYWFKLQTGLTPHRFLQCVRICKAKELLEATDFSVMQIAPMVGYSSNATLTRAFRDVTGTVPEDYRIKRGRSCREA